MNSSRQCELSLPGAGVHLWRGSLEIYGRLEEFRTLLAPDELRRAEKFRFEQVRNRFIAGRAYLRSVLSHYVPGGLEFCCGQHGKPVLTGTSGVHFNVAHSENDIVIAIARHPIGVDLEVKRPVPEIDSLAAMVFSEDEFANWKHLPVQDRLNNFLSLWTRKEALLKGIGLGITEHLKTVSVFFNDAETPLVPKSITTGKWAIRTVQEPRLVWSLASSFEPAALTSFTLD